MKLYSTDQIRNVAFSGHAGCGKTSLAEAMLFSQKVIDRQGRMEDGNTTSDYDPEEQKRQMSINTTILPIETKANKINILDLPGNLDFLGEIRNGLRVTETAIFVADATANIEGGLERVWEYAEEFNLPVVMFVNKMNKERANLERLLEALSAQFQAKFVPATLPIGAEAAFSGVVDLLRMKAVKDAAGQKASVEDIPAEMAGAAAEARTALVEAAAEGDDALMEKFFAEEPLTPEEVIRGLRGALMERRVVPVLCGAATAGIGIQTLIDFITTVVPSPDLGQGLALENGEMKKVASGEPVSLFVFKTVSDDFAGRLNFFKVMTGELKADNQVLNTVKDKGERIAHVLTMCGKKNANIEKLAAGDIGAVSKLTVTGTGDTLCDLSRPVRFAATPMPMPTCAMAISAKAKADEEKIGLGMHRLIEQDPTLSLKRDSEVQQTILSGMGDTHLDVAVARLRHQMKTEIELSIPHVAYRETITKKAQAQGKYKKQSGGRGQYGDCHVRFEPQERGAGFEFVWEVVGGVIPTKYAPAVEKGLVEAMAKGFLSNSPMVDVKAACTEGTYHNVDSSEMAFKVAASMAFKSAMLKTNPILLEPISVVTVQTPEQYMGDIMGDLNSKRGRILGMEHKGKRQFIKAQVPLSEMFTYSRELRSMTQGRGTYEIVFSHYEQVPPDVQQKIVEATTKGEEEDQ